MSISGVHEIKNIYFSVHSVEKGWEPLVQRMMRQKAFNSEEVITV